jgi:PTS system nitrogen regulatory IIA component
MTDQQVAAYLRLDVREVLKLASRGQIPCRKVGGSFQFQKGDIDHWVEEHIHELPKDRLAGIEKGVSAHHGFDHEVLLVGPLIPRGGIAVPLHARTRDGALRDLVDLADKAGVVYVREELMAEVKKREDLCSTAIAPGAALPHPRYPLPYDIANSFVVVGLSPGGIPFGADDGSLTRLFFLICCKDDRTHLHVLARLGRMLHSRAHVDQLLAAEDAEDMRKMLEELEKATLA